MTAADKTNDIALSNVQAPVALSRDVRRRQLRSDAPSPLREGRRSLSARFRSKENTHALGHVVRDARVGIPMPRFTSIPRLKLLVNATCDDGLRFHRCSRIHNEVVNYRRGRHDIVR